MGEKEEKGGKNVKGILTRRKRERKRRKIEMGLR